MMHDLPQKPAQHETGLKASVILPAHNEAGYIGACLSALLASEGIRAEVIVVANGCHDATADVARGLTAQARARGWSLEVIETPQGGKLGALNLGDAAARCGHRIYLDADVVVTPPLLRQLVDALDEGALYAGGSPRVSPARSPVTRAYARFWQTLPFVTSGVPGFGVFAIAARGRDRWQEWPQIISDDTFARLHFAPAERTRVSAGYSWPMVEGFANLVRVRRRQNRGVDEVAREFPALLANEDSRAPSPLGTLRRLLRDPVGFAVYAAVALAVRTPLFASRSAWARGR